MLCFLIFSGALAEEREEKTLEAIEFLFGYSWADLRRNDDYIVYPLIVDFDLNLKPLLHKFNYYPEQLMQLQIEPFLSLVTSPDNNKTESGISFLLKFGILPQTSKIQPYLKAGLGIAYMTQETQEQGTKFNFTEQAGAGFHYFLCDNTALTLEYRFRHLSNADMEEPNAGINSDQVIGGITYQF